MKLLNKKIPVNFIEDHKYICDLINIEGPLLSLYKDQRKSWLYFWADIEGRINRWIIFCVTRTDLVAYLQKDVNLKHLIENAGNLFCLDVEQKRPEGENSGYSYSRTLCPINEVSDIEDYMPSDDSYFDEGLTNDISISVDIVPAKFSIPIDKEWFMSDLDKFSRAYSGLYAFLYCTGDRFVKNVGDRLRFHLSSPWEGGFSRVNLFDGLIKSIPSLHDMQVKKISYASPGSIDIEALSSVGNGVAKIVANFIANKVEINHKAKLINTIFNHGKLKKKDLSSFNDEAIKSMNVDVSMVSDASNFIAEKMSVEAEYKYITQYSPNSIVTAKVLLALISQVGKLVEYEEAGMIGISHKTQKAASVSSTRDLFLEN